MTAASFCHLLFGGQVCGKTDEESQETSITPGETVRVPPVAGVHVGYTFLTTVM